MKSWLLLTWNIIVLFPDGKKMEMGKNDKTATPGSIPRDDVGKHWPSLAWQSRVWKETQLLPRNILQEEKAEFQKEKIFMLKDHAGLKLYAGSPPAGKQLCIKGMGVLVDTKLKLRQERALAAKEVSAILA